MASTTPPDPFSSTARLASTSSGEATLAHAECQARLAKGEASGERSSNPSHVDERSRSASTSGTDAEPVTAGHAVTARTALRQAASAASRTLGAWPLRPDRWFPHSTPDGSGAPGSADASGKPPPRDRAGSWDE